MKSYKPFVGILPDLQLGCRWAQRWTTLHFKVKGQGHEWDKMWSKLLIQWFKRQTFW